jgi:chromosome segregation ATPase
VLHAARPRPSIRDGTNALQDQLVDKFGQQFEILVQYAKKNIFPVDADLVLAAGSGGGGSGGSRSSGGGGGGAAATAATTEEEQALNAEMVALSARLARAQAEQQSLAARGREIEQLEREMAAHGHDFEEIKVGDRALMGSAAEEWCGGDSGRSKWWS